jgi:phage-related protein
MGSARRDLARFPTTAKRTIGQALRLAQQTRVHEDAKPMHGKFSGIMEIVANDDCNRTFRVMYLTKLHDHVYVLHAFNKKATRGIKTPQPELDLLEQRLKMAKQHYEEHYANEAPS